MDIYRNFIYEIGITIYENAMLESTKNGVYNVLRKLKSNSELDTIEEIQDRLIILLHGDIYKYSKGKFYKKSKEHKDNLSTLKNIKEIFNSICLSHRSLYVKKPPSKTWNKKKSSKKKRSPKKRSRKRRSRKKRSRKKRIPPVPLF